ncbi:TPA: type II toxin-antitoxin system PemK/MazF family toxin, partial [archaeon]|nr:type II toxin-antitoxin system PemK/MazF family toxin [Candidatus Naiadarchaeales archaeon SRR2090159.bin1288]
SRQESGLPQNSTVLLNQIRTIDKSRIAKKLGKLNAELMKKINLAIAASLGLGDQN